MIKRVKNYISSLPDREIAPGVFVSSVGFKWVHIVGVHDGIKRDKEPLEKFYNEMPGVWK